MTVRICENYRGWQPPFDAERVVEGLLDRLPDHYLAGLDSVVLTCAGRMGRRRRRGLTRSRGRKVKIAECLGLYHRAWRGRRAWIELFVDNIAGRCSPSVLRLPPVRELFVGSVLFHELGHHLHATQRPEHTENEVVAERWQRQLLDRYVKPRLWAWLPVSFWVALAAEAYRAVRILRRSRGRLPRPG